jgi:hypothetical protein
MSSYSELRKSGVQTELERHFRRELRRLYGPVAQEQLPERLKELLRAAEQQELLRTSDRASSSDDKHEKQD